MKNTLRSLLWASLAAFGAVAASGASLTVFTPTLDAGANVFNATYSNGSGTQNITVFCLDYIDSFSSGVSFSVNSSTDTSLANIVNTRYGTTTNFTNNGTGYGDAMNRYLLAAYLTTQYSSSNTSTVNGNIQTAIWTLLDSATASTHTTTSAAGNSLIAQAISWEGTQSAAQLANFENSFKILSDSQIAGTSTPARYTTGNQEFLAFGANNAVPEPSTFALMGGGLILAGLVGRFRKQA